MNEAVFIQDSERILKENEANELKNIFLSIDCILEVHPFLLEEGYTMYCLKREKKDHFKSIF